MPTRDDEPGNVGSDSHRSEVRVHLDEREVRGRAIDLRETIAAREVVGDLTPARLVQAVRRGGPRDKPADEPDSRVVVECARPGPVHEYVGHVGPAGLDEPALHGGLAAAAQSRGIEPPERAELDRVRERLASLSVPSVDLSEARRRAAEAGEEEARLRERVASLRGRIEALRETESDPGDAQVELVDAVARLSEVETERIAAEQRLDRLQLDVRAARDRREERFTLEDRLANLERAARASLVTAVHDEFVGAVETLSAEGNAGDDNEDTGHDDEDASDPVTAALAVVRLADVRAPVVLSVDRFDSAAEASDRLDAPVIRL